MPQRELWSAAKLAARAYAQDPSQKNTEKVALAWRAIRDDSAKETEKRLLHPDIWAGKGAAPARDSDEPRSS